MARVVWMIAIAMLTACGAQNAPPAQITPTVPAASETPAPEPVLSPLLAVSGALSVGVESARDGLYYAEVRVEPGAVTLGMAESLRAAAPAGMSEYSFILDDGERVADFLWRRGEWTVTEMGNP